MKRKRHLLNQLVLTSLLTAMGIVLTYYIKIPAANGYVHIGDSVIFIAAGLLPTPLAMFCGAVSGMGADLLGGYTVYAIPSLIIKSLMVLSFSNKDSKILTKRNIAACIIGAVITVTGYFIAEAIIVSIGIRSFDSVSLTAALYTIPANVIQSAASSAVFFALAAALDRSDIKKIISKQ